MHVRSITRADLSAFGDVVAKAMWNDEVINILSPYRNQYPDSNIRYCTHRAKVRFYRGEHMLVAVSDPSDPDWTGEEVIMGYASYATTVKSVQKTYPSGWLGNTFEQKALQCYESYAKLFRIDRSCDPVAQQKFRSLADNPHFETYFDTIPQWHKQLKGDQHWELELLGVHPDFRRKGIGKLLLQWGFERATRDMVPLVLLASLTGEKLYLHTGFREVKRLEMTFDVETEQKTFSWALMVWEPPNYRENAEQLAVS